MGDINGMVMFKIFRHVFVFFWLATSAAAQSTVWIQVEAQPTLNEAQSRARSYAAALDDVAGYYLGSGWYGIVLGPYTDADAQSLLRTLRNNGQIPRDSFIAFGRNFQQQFWPVGVGAATTAQPLPDDSPNAVNEPVVEAAPLIIPDETPRQARQSEALLNRQEREQLQVALKWAGVYPGAIDGAYGRGTRAAMRDWQTANSHEATGVMTTSQRAELLDAYNAVLAGMDLRLVQDKAAGIEIKMPTGVVAFSKYDPPFARYNPKGDLPAQVVLISQEGDQNRLFGLYEILQTLEVVPTDGPRTRNNRSFEIAGTGKDLQSYTFVSRDNGRIKGFMLVWPTGDTARFDRVLAEMKASFRRIDGVLDPAMSQPNEDQATDLIAGLAIRKPRLSRSGFFIDGAGTVLTTIEAVDQCERLTINTDTEAEVTLRDDALGVAVVRPTTTLAPIAYAAFQTAVPRLQSEVAVAGYPYGGVLVTPSLTFGRLADLRGLNGEEEIKRLALTAQSGDAGGPVFDNGGAVLGMLLPRNGGNGQVLPAEVSFAVNADNILGTLSEAGIDAETTDTVAFVPPETLTLLAADQTVLVSCW